MPASPQMVSVHVSADANTWGWQPLMALLNPAFVHPFDAPHIQVEGSHVSWDGYLQSLGDHWGGSLWCQCNPPTAGVEATGSTPLDSWGGSLYMVAVGNGGIFWVGWGRTWRSMIELPSRAHTDPPTPILPQPTVLSAPPPSPITAHPPILHVLIIINPAPGRQKRVCHKGQAQPQNSERTVREAKWYHAKRHTWLNNPFPSSSTNPSIPPTSTHDLIQSTSYSSFVVTLSSSPFDNLSADDDNPKWT